jgi:hypothetical protein
MSQIGRCKGCYEVNRLDDGVCSVCLNHTLRGRSWADMSHKCRTDPAYALAVYCHIKTETTRENFVKMYGLPPGAERLAVGKPKLRLVN